MREMRGDALTVEAPYRLTQGQVERLARQYGVRRTTRDGIDPDKGGLTNSDIRQGTYGAVLGSPDGSLHELVHGVLGAPPETVPEECQDEFLLVEPLERALAAWLEGRAPEGAHVRQLVAAGLWRAGAPVWRLADAQDWAAACEMMLRERRIARARATRAVLPTISARSAHV